MYHFKNLKVDPSSINSARTFSELVDEDEKITEEKEAREKQKISLQAEQLKASYEQNLNLLKLQNQLLEEQRKREQSEARAKRVNLITSVISIGLSAVAIIVSIILGLIN